MNKEITISAPGKVLIAGGYLVLEPPNIGIVLASNQRFYSTVSIDSIAESITETEDDSNNNTSELERLAIDIHSPQFHTKFQYWLYYTPNNDNNLRIQSRTKQKSNVILEQTILMTFSFIYVHQGRNDFQDTIHKLNSNTLKIILHADNDFYSQYTYLKKNNIPSTCYNVTTLPKFLPCPKDEEGKVIINKTGLGSSAALVTSIVSSILKFWNVIDVTKELELIHKLSQTIHCLAQGKIGSGFDVACAIYGSMIYTRFSKDILQDLFSLYSSSAAAGSETSDVFSKLLNVTTQKDWDYTIKPLKLPSFLEILMADVCGGSESPSMARKVLQWKKEGDNALDLWNKLGSVNEDILDTLDTITNLYDDANDHEYDIALKEISALPSTEWKSCNSSTKSKEFINKLLNLQSHFLKSRSLLKEIGTLSKVPIEPEIQTELANDTMKLPGVLTAGIPGAGGYDALYVVYVRGEESFGGRSDIVRDGIGDFWMEKGGSVCPLCLKSVGYGFGLREEVDFSS